MEVLKLRLEQVQIPEYRQRKEIDGEKLAALMDSVGKVGLLHPIVVREGNVLVVGERRLRAISNLAGTGEGIRFGGEAWEAGFIPAIDIKTLSPEQAEEAELEENVCRVDLTWQERAAATDRLMAYRRHRAGVLGQPVPTVGEIALKVRGSEDGRNHEDTRRELILAQHLQDPEIAKAKSLKEGFEILRRREQTQRNIEKGREIGASLSRNSHTLVRANCIEWLNDQPAEQFDVICTDPPYGINAQDFGDADGRLKTQTHTYDDSPEAWRELMKALAGQLFRIAKKEAHLYICCDIDRFVELKEIMGDEGWEVHRTPIVNIKKDGSRVPWPYWGPQRKWEIILYAMKGKKPVTKIYPDYMETLGDDNLGHGAQKPVSMYLDLLKRSITPGDKILDPFCGTGTVFVAAHQMKCIATGVEQDENYYGIALKRLEELS